MPRPAPRKTRKGPASPDSGPPSLSAGRRILPGLLLAGLVFAVFFPTLWGDFLWDDQANIIENPNLRDAAGLRNTWTKPFANQQYYPLTYTTYWIEYQLQGTRPLLFRLNNLWLHALAGVALWRVLKRLGVPGAWVAAALFALHPLQCESIGWITERRNILAGVFAAFSTLWFLRGAGIGMAGPPRKPWEPWGVSLAFFASALLSKTAVAPLPAVFLVLLWWKKPRWERRDLLATLPFFVLALGMAFLTVAAEQNSAPPDMKNFYTFSLAQRMVIAARGAFFYARQILFPDHLSLIYPKWKPLEFGWPQYLIPMAVVALLAVLWGLRRRLGKGPLAAALVFGMLLAPASGFFSVIYFAFSFVADRFQYFSGPALLALVVAGAVQGLTFLTRDQQLRQRLAVGLSVVALGILGFLSRERIVTFATPETFWREAMRSNPQAWTPFFEVGRLLSVQNKPKEALPLLDEAIRLQPRSGLAWYERGYVMESLGRPEEALKNYLQAIQFQPHLPGPYNNLGIMLEKQGRLAEAVQHYRKAIERSPRLAAPHANLAIALFKLGDFPGAWREVAEARALGAEPHPDFIAALTRKSPPPR